MNIRLTKKFTFEMAHALWNYDGPCKYIHGHSYILYITVIGKPESKEKSPKNGMVLDFGILKNIVNKEIVDVFDHALVVNSKADYSKVLKEEQIYDKIVSVDYQPTSELMIIDFVEKIKKLLPENIELFSVRLNETATSYAEWYASDN